MSTKLPDGRVISGTNRDPRFFPHIRQGTLIARRKKLERRRFAKGYYGAKQTGQRRAKSERE